uniref:D-alanyl-D-alanine carboxypeptidase family protein n=1 Tax=Vibrio maerlii TaxID=2231648 RepID=UPI000E3E2DF6|nr:D-alanyl-D-alanine carboxypeptidase family protein [Vibrio maerlii]
MSSKLRISIAALCASFAASVAAAPTIVPQAPAVSAKGYVLLDYNSGQIIADKSAHTPLKPASLTKLMTSYVTGREMKSGNIAMDDKVVISRNAWSRNFPDSSKMFIEVGKTVEMSDLFRGLIVQSGNDASVAIAEHVASSEQSFVDLMNAWAKKLELNNTYFENSHGLDTPNQASTPYDIAKLSQALIRDLPDLYPIYSETSFSYNGITQNNRNRLLHDRSINVDGLKTGYTSGAGYSLVTSATQGDMRLISVVMGSNSTNSRAAESKALLNYGFRFFDTVKPHQMNETVIEQRLYMGSENQVALGLSEPIYITTTRGERAHIQAEANVNSTLKAPISKGQVLGTVDYLDRSGEVIKSADLIALADVEKGGIFKQLLDWIKLLFV